MDLRDSSGDGGRTGYRNCRWMSINSQLEGKCRQEMVILLTCGRPLQDGLHMTDRGAAVLGVRLCQGYGQDWAFLLN